MGDKIITLDDDTMASATAEARARHRVSREAGHQDRQIGRQDSVTTDLLGLMGEIAFEKMFNAKRDSRVFARSGSTDFILDNKVIEVKTSMYQNAHLLIPAYKINGVMTVKEHSDYYVLMVANIKNKTVRFAGWASREEIINEKNLEYFAGYDRLSFVLKQSKLHKNTKN